MYNVRLQKKAKKNLVKIDKRWHKRIVATLDDIAAQPHNGKQLDGDKRGQYVVRVWPYRIIYEIHDDVLVVLVIDIAHRQEAYK